MFTAPSARRKRKHYEDFCGFIPQPYVFQANPRRDEKLIAIFRILAGFSCFGAAIAQLIIFSLNMKNEAFDVEAVGEKIEEDNILKRAKKKKKLSWLQNCENKAWFLLFPGVIFYYDWKVIIRPVLGEEDVGLALPKLLTNLNYVKALFFIFWKPEKNWNLGISAGWYSTHVVIERIFAIKDATSSQ